MDKEKFEQYKKLCGGTPDAFYLLSRGIVEVEGCPGEYKSGGYEDLDVHQLLSGGSAVSSAGATLHHYFPEVFIVANSKLPENIEPVSNARVFQKELIEQGVNPEKIILQENSYSTFTEIGELVKLIVNKSLKHVVVITNEFHIKRAKVLLDRIDLLKDLNGYWQEESFQTALKKFKESQPEPKISFVSAEDILSLYNQDYTEMIEKLKKSKEWEKRVASEERGIADILKGTYWSENNSKNFIRP
jgi:hypothetical protein